MNDGQSRIDLVEDLVDVLQHLQLVLGRVHHVVPPLVQLCVRAVCTMAADQSPFPRPPHPSTYPTREATKRNQRNAMPRNAP
jgi:hypothetical protein